MRTTRLEVMVVPDGGNYYLTIPESVCKLIGWKPGDIVKIDIPTTYPDQLIIMRK